MKMDDNDYDINLAVDELNSCDNEANKTRQHDTIPDIYSDEFMQRVQAKWGPFEPKGIQGVIHGLKHSSRDERSDIISSVIIIGSVIIGIVLLLKWIF
jgi:hypothetical protein